MRLTLSKSKNAEQVYITKSFRNKQGKATSKIFKKLGRMSDLMQERNESREEVIAWAKAQAKFYTEKEKQEKITVNIAYNENKEIKMNKQVSFNAGYLFLKSIFYDLKLDKLCDEIKTKHKFNYKLTDILEKLVYARMLEPTSKLSTFKFSKNFIEQPKFDLHHIYRALDVLNASSDFIQAKLYENSLDVIDRNAKILYYDCTNYFFEIEEEDDFRKYGKNKEHRPNPIVQMGLFLDGNGIPLCFSTFAGNQNEQPSLKPLEKKIINDFKLSKFVVCTDAGLASYANRKFNAIGSRSFITTQSLKQLKQHLKDWALDKEGWQRTGSDKYFNLDEIAEDNTHTFYKERWINENGLEQRLIVTFSNKYKNYQKHIRESQVHRATKLIDKNASIQNNNMNSPKRFITERKVTKEGEIAEISTLSLNYDKIQTESMYDGFYGVCTNLEDEVKDIIDINHKRWEIEESFKIMKSEFKARPVYLSKQERINAHFLICFLSLVLFRIFEKKHLEEKYTTTEIIKTLRNMNMLEAEGFGYIPSFERTDLINELQEKLGINLCKEITSHKTMKKFLKDIKK